MNITHCLLSALAGGAVFCVALHVAFVLWLLPKRVTWLSTWRPFIRGPDYDRVGQIKRLLDTHCLNTYSGVDEGKIRTIAAYWLADYELELCTGARKAQREVVFACDAMEYARRYPKKGKAAA